MFDKLQKVLRDFLIIVTSNIISFLGALITTTSVAVFFIFLGVSLFTFNNYVGILGFFIVPAAFVSGLVMIPFGFLLYRKRMGIVNFSQVAPSKLMEKLKVQEPRGFLSFILFLTLINVSILAVAGYESFQYMESNEFCGTLCHKVMNPEYTAYNDSPHARVPCVECHIGSGANSFIKSKLSGTRQMFAVLLNTYHRPIKTPLHDLRPARETCEHCHWPEKFRRHGPRIRNIIHYGKDEKNTPDQTVLLMNIGSAAPGEEKGIHRHISKDFGVRYISENDEREKITWVELFSRKGPIKEWAREGYQPTEKDKKKARIMDCIDCHNRATHTYLSLGVSLDDAMAAGKIDPDIPFVRREAEKALKISHPDKEEAIAEIRKSLEDFYTKNYPEIFEAQKEKIKKSIEEIVWIYRRNIHPSMKITWDTYPNYIGHVDSPGCYRCHGGELVTSGGDYISTDCTMCHTILRYAEPSPKDIAELTF